MTTQATKPIWQQIREEVEADAEHKRLSEAHRDLCRQENEQNTALTSGTHKLQRLLIARDAVQHFIGELSATDPDEDANLERLTANCGECWHGMFNAASDEITESILDLCEVLTEQRTKRTTLRTQRTAAYELVRLRADQVEADYKQKHSGTPGPA